MVCHLDVKWTPQDEIEAQLTRESRLSTGDIRAKYVSRVSGPRNAPRQFGTKGDALLLPGSRELLTTK